MRGIWKYCAILALVLVLSRAAVTDERDTAPGHGEPVGVRFDANLRLVGQGGGPACALSESGILAKYFPYVVLENLFPKDDPLQDLLRKLESAPERRPRLLTPESPTFAIRKESGRVRVLSAELPDPLAAPLADEALVESVSQSVREFILTARSTEADPRFRYNLELSPSRATRLGILSGRLDTGPLVSGFLPFDDLWTPKFFEPQFMPEPAKQAGNFANVRHHAVILRLIAIALSCPRGSSLGKSLLNLLQNHQIDFFTVGGVPIGGRWSDEEIDTVAKLLELEGREFRSAWADDVANNSDRHAGLYNLAPRSRVRALAEKLSHQVGGRPGSPDANRLTGDARTSIQILAGTDPNSELHTSDMTSTRRKRRAEAFLGTVTAQESRLALEGEPRSARSNASLTARGQGSDSFLSNFPTGSDSSSQDTVTSRRRLSYLKALYAEIMEQLYRGGDVEALARVLDQVKDSLRVTPLDSFSMGHLGDWAKSMLRKLEDRDISWRNKLGQEDPRIYAALKHNLEDLADLVDGYFISGFEVRRSLGNALAQESSRGSQLGEFASAVISPGRDRKLSVERAGQLAIPAAQTAFSQRFGENMPSETRHQIENLPEFARTMLTLNLMDGLPATRANPRYPSAEDSKLRMLLDTGSPTAVLELIRSACAKEYRALQFRNGSYAADPLPFQGCDQYLRYVERVLKELGGLNPPFPLSRWNDVTPVGSLGEWAADELAKLNGRGDPRVRDALAFLMGLAEDTGDTPGADGHSLEDWILAAGPERALMHNDPQVLEQLARDEASSLKRYPEVNLRPFEKMMDEVGGPLPTRSRIVLRQLPENDRDLLQEVVKVMKKTSLGRDAAERLLLYPTASAIHAAAENYLPHLKNYFQGASENVRAEETLAEMIAGVAVKPNAETEKAIEARIMDLARARSAAYISDQLEGKKLEEQIRMVENQIESDGMREAVETEVRHLAAQKLIEKKIKDERDKRGGGALTADQVRALNLERDSHLQAALRPLYERQATMEIRQDLAREGLRPREIDQALANNLEKNHEQIEAKIAESIHSALEDSGFQPENSFRGNSGVLDRAIMDEANKGAEGILACVLAFQKGQGDIPLEDRQKAADKLEQEAVLQTQIAIDALAQVEAFRTQGKKDEAEAAENQAKDASRVQTALRLEAQLLRTPDRMPSLDGLQLSQFLESKTRDHKTHIDDLSRVSEMWAVPRNRLGQQELTMQSELKAIAERIQVTEKRLKSAKEKGSMWFETWFSVDEIAQCERTLAEQRERLDPRVKQLKEMEIRLAAHMISPELTGAGQKPAKPETQRAFDAVEGWMRGISPPLSFNEYTEKPVDLFQNLKTLSHEEQRRYLAQQNYHTLNDGTVIPQKLYEAVRGLAAAALLDLTNRNEAKGDGKTPAGLWSQFGLPPMDQPERQKSEDEIIKIYLDSLIAEHLFRQRDGALKREGEAVLGVLQSEMTAVGGPGGALAKHYHTLASDCARSVLEPSGRLPFPLSGADESEEQLSRIADALKDYQEFRETAYHLYRALYRDGRTDPSQLDEHQQALAQELKTKFMKKMGLSSSQADQFLAPVRESALADSKNEQAEVGKVIGELSKAGFKWDGSKLDWSQVDFGQYDTSEKLKALRDELKRLSNYGTYKKNVTDPWQELVKTVLAAHTKRGYARRFEFGEDGVMRGVVANLEDGAVVKMLADPDEAYRYFRFEDLKKAQNDAEKNYTELFGKIPEGKLEPEGGLIQKYYKIREKYRNMHALQRVYNDPDNELRDIIEAIKNRSNALKEQGFISIKPAGGAFASLMGTQSGSLAEHVFARSDLPRLWDEINQDYANFAEFVTKEAAIEAASLALTGGLGEIRHLRHLQKVPLLTEMVMGVRLGYRTQLVQKPLMELFMNATHDYGYYRTVPWSQYNAQADQMGRTFGLMPGYAGLFGRMGLTGNILAEGLRDGLAMMAAGLTNNQISAALGEPHQPLADSAMHTLEMLPYALVNVDARLLSRWKWLAENPTATRIAAYGIQSQSGAALGLLNHHYLKPLLEMETDEALRAEKLKYRDMYGNEITSNAGIYWDQVFQSSAMDAVTSGMVPRRTSLRRAKLDLLESPQNGLESVKDYARAIAGKQQISDEALFREVAQHLEPSEISRMFDISQMSDAQVKREFRVTDAEVSKVRKTAQDTLVYAAQALEMTRTNGKADIGLLRRVVDSMGQDGSRFRRHTPLDEQKGYVQSKALSDLFGRAEAGGAGMDQLLKSELIRELPRHPDDDHPFDPEQFRYIPAKELNPLHITTTRDQARAGAELSASGSELHRELTDAVSQHYGFNPDKFADFVATSSKRPGDTVSTLVNDFATRRPKEVARVIRDRQISEEKAIEIYGPTLVRTALGRN